MMIYFASNAQDVSSLNAVAALSIVNISETDCGRIFN